MTTKNISVFSNTKIILFIIMKTKILKEVLIAPEAKRLFMWWIRTRVQIENALPGFDLLWHYYDLNEKKLDEITIDTIINSVCKYALLALLRNTNPSCWHYPDHETYPKLFSFAIKNLFSNEQISSIIFDDENSETFCKKRWFSPPKSVNELVEYVKEELKLKINLSKALNNSLSWFDECCPCCC